MTYPNDIEGNLCGWDAQAYKILYYTTIDDPSKRLCVKSCPKGDESSLDCYATDSLSCGKNDNEDYKVEIYPSEIYSNRLGLFCMPTDENQKSKILEMSGINRKNVFLSTYDSIFKCLWIGVIYGIIYLIAMQIFPIKAVNWVFALGGLSALLIGILLFILPSGSILLKVVFGLLCIILACLIFYSIIK